MNKKGQVIFYGLMLTIVILILALAMAFPVKESIDIARNATDGDTIGMDCSNSSISDFQKAACTTTDLTLFYFIGGLIGLAGIVAGARILME